MTTQIPAFPPGADALQQVGPKRWRKQIFPFGREFMHPKDPKRVLRFTQEFARRMVENFNRGVRDIVPVPAEHSESWQDNHGRVVALEIVPERGVYGVLEVDDEADRAIREKRLAGVSASFAENYTDRETGSRIGPVLRHVALTNGPYIEGMDPFQAAVALSEDDDAADLVFLSTDSPGGFAAPPHGSAAADRAAVRGIVDRHGGPVHRRRLLDREAAAEAAAEAARAAQEAEDAALAGLRARHRDLDTDELQVLRRLSRRD